MMELKVNVPQIREFLNQIIQAPGKVFDLLRVDIRETMNRFLRELMESEISFFLGRRRYERLGPGSLSPKGKRGRPNHRNGYYARGFTIKGIGGVHVSIPRDRLGKYKTQVLPRYQRYESQIKEDMS